MLFNVVIPQFMMVKSLKLKDMLFILLSDNI